MTAAIAAPELRDLIATDPDIRILDVRSGSEFESAHIPGSYNVPLDTLAEHARDLAKVDKPVVLVCQSGARATQAHARLANEGKVELKVLEGGIGSWERVGGEIVRGAEKWAMDRQVRLVAGSLVLTGIVASLFVPKARFLSGAVGAGLTFSAVSNTCAMASMLGRLPYNRGNGCDIDSVLRRMDGVELDTDGSAR